MHVQMRQRVYVSRQSERNCKKEATIVRIMLLCVARTRTHASKHARASERESAREREGGRERERERERESERETH